MTVLTVNVLNPMIKNIFLRRRPYFDNKEIDCLKAVDSEADIYNISAQGYSFPSAHSANSVAVFTPLAAAKKKAILIALGILMPLFVGVSRFALGVHYPTDVIAGWALGLILVFAVPALYRAIKNRWVFFGLMLLISFPGFFYCRSADFFTGFGLLIGFNAATIFEEKVVKFENTRSPIRSILRVVGGIVIFLVLNTLLKLPFSDQFLESGSMASYCVRTLRYAIIIFIDIGIYPMLFKYTDRIF